ncbi:MAG: GNAT family N-acetyltransferase [Xanthobacteraceae bacterium]|nr:GNAT family N-acetyltransferase [Bradyrhizobium sp.]
MDRIPEPKSRRDERIDYRPAMPDDGAAIAGLICQAGGGLYEFLFDDLIPFVRAFDIVAAGVGMSDSPLSWENCLVATGGSAGVVGVANFFPADSISDETFLSLVSDRFEHIRPMLQLLDRGSMFLNAVAVAGNYRGNGIGTRLIERAEARALEAGLPRLSLHVWVDNVPAIRLYKRHGFTEVGIAELAASPRLPHRGGSLLMRKTLLRSPD